MQSGWTRSHLRVDQQHQVGSCYRPSSQSPARTVKHPISTMSSAAKVKCIVATTQRIDCRGCWTTVILLTQCHAVILQTQYHGMDPYHWRFNWIKQSSSGTPSCHNHLCVFLVVLGPSFFRRSRSALIRSANFDSD